MYKVYRDPEGNSVEIGMTIPDQQTRNSFQFDEEVYKSHIQKLNREVTMLQKKVCTI